MCGVPTSLFCSLLSEHSWDEITPGISVMHRRKQQFITEYIILHRCAFVKGPEYARCANTQSCTFESSWRNCKLHFRHQQCNWWTVDMSSRVIAVFNSKPSRTMYTIQYAKGQKILSTVLRHRTGRFRRFRYSDGHMGNRLIAGEHSMERNKGLEALCLKSLWMEHRGFEPLTSTMRTLRATNCANAPKFNLISVWFLQIVLPLLSNSRALYQLVLSQSADKV